ncbi:lipid A biosynthesis lauroyl acyltransferase [Hyphobacterium sp. CCMP332]|nr:lipid A biosynthesis lauroyl acyltransferase [Hyphobacterium sp. CCMP332]
MRLRKEIKYHLLVNLIKGFVSFVSFFPRKVGLFFFTFYGHLAFLLVKKQRQKTIANIRFALGDKLSEKEIHEMAKKVFIHQSKNLVDYMHAIKVKSREAFAKYVDIVGETHLKTAYDRGKGVICLVSHTGSWEFSAITPSILGYETTAVSKALRHPKMNDLIVGYRQSRGLKNLNRGDTYKQLVEALNSGDCLIIMIDQDTKVKSCFVDFLGHPAYTPVGAAMLALDTEAAVVPMSMHRKKNDKHQFTIRPELELVKTGNRIHDLKENTKLFSAEIEEFVKMDLSQWVWMHERWKTTPESIKELVKAGIVKDTSLVQDFI